MPKTIKQLPDQLNFLAPEGTMSLLVAISYFRGETGRYAGPARDFVLRGIREWQEDLPEKDKARFREILQNVRLTRNSQV